MKDKKESLFGWFSTNLTIALPLTTTYRTAALKMVLCTLLNPRTYSKKLCFSSCASQARKYFSLLRLFSRPIVAFWGCNWNGPRSHLGPWLFWSPRNLVPEKFGPQEIWSPRNLVPRKFGPQEIWSPRSLVPRKNGPPKNLSNMKEI